MVDTKYKWTATAFILGFIVILGLLFFSNNGLLWLFPQKVYSHRTNTPEALRTVLGHFTGLELDAVYDAEANVFYVYHPPDENINLTLDAYLAEIPHPKDLRFWIDLKNLDTANSGKALLRLKNLAHNYRIDSSRVIIESPQPMALQAFSEAGFKTAYYLPTDLRQMDSAVLYEEIAHITQRLQNNPTDYISADYREYHVLTRHFPGHEKILWFTVYGELNRFEARYLLWKILFDPTVQVLLIPA